MTAVVATERPEIYEHDAPAQIFEHRRLVVNPCTFAELNGVWSAAGGDKATLFVSLLVTFSFSDSCPARGSAHEACVESYLTSPLIS